MPAPDQFYLDDPPTHLQQGDIAAGVPILLLPGGEELVLIRSSHHRLQIEHLEAGEVELVREQAVADAFDTGYEYVVAAAETIWAMLMTPTCDLPDLDVWAVWPMYPVERSGKEKALQEPHHPTLFRIPDHKNFPPSYIDVTDFRSIRKEHFRLKDRVASVSPEAQHDLTERFLKAAGRPWGYGPGEAAEKAGKYATGVYRCARCNLYNVPPSEVARKPGETFPICEQCKRVNKSAQWYPITKHRKT